MKSSVERGMCYLLALLMVANTSALDRQVALAQPPAEPVTKATPAEPTPEELKRRADEMEPHLQGPGSAREGDPPRHVRSQGDPR